MAEAGNIHSSQSDVLQKKKIIEGVNHFVGFIKRIARMSVADRKKILCLLKKQKRKRKGGADH